jgi:hypothetical protein
VFTCKLLASLTVKLMPCSDTWHQQIGPCVAYTDHEGRKCSAPQQLVIGAKRSGHDLLRRLQY